MISIIVICYDMIEVLDYDSQHHDEIIEEEFDDERDFAKIGIQIGAVSTMELSSNLELLSEVSFVQKGLSMSDGGLSIKYTLNYIEINPSAVVNYNERFSFLGGIYSGVLVGGKSTFKYDGDTDTEKLDMDDFDERWDFGLTLGPSILITDNLEIDVIYKLGLTDIDDSDLVNKGLSICGRMMF